MLRKILIADDNKMNRALLKRMLRGAYTVSEAVDGRQTLELLKKAPDEYSAVLLDLIMPEPDGYEVLRRMRSDEALAHIPVIVTTGSTDEGAEIMALSLGANDYITKPYNADIIRHRLSNTIHLRETAAYINAIQRDKLTGLYNRETFFEKAAELIASHEAGHYVLTCFDINDFKAINDQYGSETGDRVLRLIADCFSRSFGATGGVCCRIMADHFAAMYPKSILGSEELIALRQRLSVLDGSIPPISFSIGRYLVDDLALPVSAMYDRAVMAKSTVKGRFDVQIAQYDEAMRELMLREQEISREMKGALENRHFEVWLQPQYNHATGALIGAEALVRWRHPKRGLIPPGAFIPVFEQNGFIYEMDKYVWTEAAALLRKWLDAGRAPLPISVNISRYDIFREDLVDVLCGLVREYDIPVELLRLEITESAFARSTEQIVQVVRRLIDCGFTVEIDDFGSGYSSLNTLKDVPADVLKLDMRFLESDGNSQRGGNILESVVRMAKWLGMSVIAEGVETAAQADFLRSIGCSYVQGFLYARPMPVEEYESLFEHIGREEKMLGLETVEHLDNNAFWDPHSLDTLIFNSYVGSACIFEYHQGNIELLRATDSYPKMLGNPDLSVEDTLKLVWREHFDEENHRVFQRAMQRSIDTKSSVTGEYVFHDLPGCPERTYLRSTIRVIATTGDRYLLYCTNENITAQREAEQKERLAAEQLQIILANVQGGVTTAVIRDDIPSLIFVNEQFYTLLGFTKEQYEREVENPHELIHPDDRERVVSATAEASRTREPFSITYRIIRRDGAIRWVRNNVSMIAFPGVDAPVQLGVINDITKEMEDALRIRSLNENLQSLMSDTPGGFARMHLEPDGSLRMVYMNERFCKLYGMSQEELLSSDRKDARLTVHPDDLDAVKAALSEMLETGETHTHRYRLKRSDGSYVWVLVFGRVTRSETGETYINTYYADLSEQAKDEMAYREMLPVALSTMMETSPDIAFVKDSERRYISCSRAFIRNSGFTDEADLVGKTDYDILDKELADRYDAEDLDILRRGEPLLDRISRIPSADGSPRYSKTSKYPLRDASGHIIGIYGVGRDITEERETFQQLKFLTDNLPGGIATYEFSDAGIRALYYNDGQYAYSGYTREEYAEMLKTDPLALMYEEDRPGLYAAAEGLKRNADGTAECRFRCRTKDGRCRWFLMKGAVSSVRGGVMTAHTVQYDITDQVLAEEAERLREEAFMRALSRMDKWLFLYDIPRRTLTLPEGYAHDHDLPTVLTGFPECTQGYGLFPLHDNQSFDGLIKAIRRGEPHCTAEAHVVGQNGRWRWLRIESTTVFDEDGAPERAVIMLEDVTVQRESAETNELLATLCDNYYALYLLDTEQDRNIPLKLSEELGTVTHGNEIRWSSELEPALLALVAPEYRLAVRGILGRRAVSRAFSALHEHRELLFRQVNDTWKKIVVQPLEIRGGVTVRALATITDVTESKRQMDAINAEREQEYKRASEYERLLVDAAADKYANIVKIDLATGRASRIEFASDAPVERDLKKWDEYLADIQTEFHPDDRAAARKASFKNLSAIPPGGSISLTYRRRVRRNGYRWYTTVLRAARGVSRSDAPRYATAFTVDINDEMIERSRLKDLSEHDGLTDLFNRVKYEAMCETEYRDLSACGVLFFDVNELKHANDTFGHEAGDALLCRVADSIRSVTNRHVHGYRFGGDEFVVIVPDAGEAELEPLIHMWGTRLSTLSKDQLHPCAVAVGKAWSRAPLSVDALIAAADADMYRNKESMKQGAKSSAVKGEVSDK